MITSTWLAVGLLAQVMFTARFLVQWIASERKRESTVPIAFWYLSLAGGIMLLAYAVRRHDPVFALGQSAGLVVYVRNLMLLRRKQAGAGVADRTTRWQGLQSRLRRQLPWLLLTAFALVMGFTFQGARGLTEPDEGRYAEVAREMLESGDFISPQLDGRPHFSKPPLTYWCIATSISLFGYGEWSVRLFLSLAYAGTILLVARTATDLWGRRTGITAGAIYATSLTPFAGASVVTPDTLLVLWEALAVWAFFRGGRAERRAARWGWPLLTGAAFGLGFLTKGPPALLFLPAMILARVLFRRRGTEMAPVVNWIGMIAFAVLGVGWYVVAARHHHGLLDYWWTEELVGRIAGQHHRNPEWYGPLAIYLPALTVGALPWCLAWPRLWQRAAARVRALGWRSALQQQPEAATLMLMVILPLVVLSLARSRLPLYVLPVFVPLAIGTARPIQALIGSPRRGLPELRGWGRRLAVWSTLLLAGRLLAAWMIPQQADARRVFASLPESPTAEIVVDDGRAHHGLAFYCRRDLVYAASPDAPGSGPTLDEEVAEHRDPHCHEHIFLVRPEVAPDLLEKLEAADATIVETHELPELFAVMALGTRTGDTEASAPGLGPPREDVAPARARRLPAR